MAGRTNTQENTNYGCGKTNQSKGKFFAHEKHGDQPDSKEDSCNTPLEQLIRLKKDQDEQIENEKEHYAEEEKHAKADAAHLAKMEQRSKELDEQIKKATSK